MFTFLSLLLFVLSLVQQMKEWKLPAHNVHFNHRLSGLYDRRECCAVCFYAWYTKSAKISVEVLRAHTVRLWLLSCLTISFGVCYFFFLFLFRTIGLFPLECTHLPQSQINTRIYILQSVSSWKLKVFVGVERKRKGDGKKPIVHMLLYSIFFFFSILQFNVFICA